MATSLGDVLGGGAVSESTTTAAEVPAAAEAAPSVSAEPASQAETGEKAKPADVAPPATEQHSDHDDDSDPHPVPRKALIEERKKRQETERQLAEMRGQLAAFQQFAKPPQPEVQVPQSDPETDFYGNPVKFVDERLNSVKQEMERQRVAMSGAMARAQFPDFDEKLQAFAEAVKNAPHLEQQALNHPHPAMFAYEMGKTYLETTKYGGSIDEMRKKIRDELRAEVEQEIRKQLSSAAVEQANKSTAGVRGSGATAGATFSGPTSLKAIIGR